MTTNTATMTVHAIPDDELNAIRLGRDVAGNRPVPWSHAVGSPLRCCLRRVRPDDEVLLTSHAPLRRPSPWREVGPVFVHAGSCAGYDEDAGLPAELRHGPRVLRGYRADGSLDYDAIRVVGDVIDLAEPLAELLGAAGVTEVHVRAVDAQCFVYLVRPTRP